MDTIEVVSYLVYLAMPSMAPRSPRIGWSETLFEMSDNLELHQVCETTLPQTSTIFQNAIKNMANNCE